MAELILQVKNATCDEGSTHTRLYILCPSILQTDHKYCASLQTSILSISCWSLDTHVDTRVNFMQNVVHMTFDYLYYEFLNQERFG